MKNRFVNIYDVGHCYPVLMLGPRVLQQCSSIYTANQGPDSDEPSVRTGSGSSLGPQRPGLKSTDAAHKFVVAQLLLTSK